jgi:hypothetical protein
MQFGTDAFLGQHQLPENLPLADFHTGRRKVPAEFSNDTLRAWLLEIGNHDLTDILGQLPVAKSDHASHPEAHQIVAACINLATRGQLDFTGRHFETAHLAADMGAPRRLPKSFFMPALIGFFDKPQKIPGRISATSTEPCSLEADRLHPVKQLPLAFGYGNPIDLYQA